MTEPTETERLLTAVAGSFRTFAAAVDRENAAIRAREVTSLAALGAAKATAAQACEAHLSALRDATDDLAALDAAQRHQLREVRATVEPLVAMNARLLTIAVQAGRRFMASVSAAAKSASPGASVYGRSGTVDAGARQGIPTSVAVSFNRTL